MNNIEKKRIVRYFIISKMLHLRYNDTTKQKRRRDTRMRELFVETRTAVGEDGRLHSFDYYVVIGEMEVGGRFACESYGVKVAEQGGDIAVIPNITVSISRIDALVDRMLRNTVSPASPRTWVHKCN